MNKPTPAQLLAPYIGLSLHHLYEASVQNVDADVDFIEDVYEELRGGEPGSLREDFCGTAALCAEWIKRDPTRVAYGVDLDEPTLEWGRKHRIGLLGDHGSQVVLSQEDVRTAKSPTVDVQVAFNFSYFIFTERAALRDYFSSVHASLNQGGLFLMDLFGGVESEQELLEKTRYPAQVDPDGTEVPEFTYHWDQHRLNAIDRSLRCFIHFKIKGGPKIKKAFRYDWRLWMLPELRELLAQAGFSASHVYAEGWDDDADEPDGDFKRKKRLDNEGGYVSYLVAER